MLTPYCEAADVHRNGDHYFGVPGRLAGFVVDITGLDAFPLRSAVLEPNFDLYLAQLQRVRDLRAFRQRQVFLTVKLLLQFQKLLAGEGRPPPPVLPGGRGASGTVGAVHAVVHPSARLPFIFLTHGASGHVVV